MATDPSKESGAEQHVRWGFLRSLLRWLVLSTSLVVIAGWMSTGFYRLALGEAAVILRLGKLERVESREGLNWHWPEPLEYGTTVNVAGSRSEEFGISVRAATEAGAELAEAAPAVEPIQTADGNLVDVGYEVQYRVDDAFSFAFGADEPRRMLRDASEAAVREVIGRKSVEQVLGLHRGEIESEARDILERTLAEYFEGQGRRPAFRIDRLNLQSVRPPEPVQEAFAAVLAAQQEAEQSTSSARSEAREILERAHAEVTELSEGAEGYRETKLLEAEAAAARFVALLAEYERSPEVTRRRLYLETMEQILPKLETLVVDPELAGLLPWLSAPRRGGDDAAEGGK